MFPTTPTPTTPGFMLEPSRLNAGRSTKTNKFYTTKELKFIASKLGLSSTGTKKVLVQKIIGYISTPTIQQQPPRVFSPMPVFSPTLIMSPAPVILPPPVMPQTNPPSYMELYKILQTLVGKFVYIIEGVIYMGIAVPSIVDTYGTLEKVKLVRDEVNKYFIAPEQPIFGFKVLSSEDQWIVYKIIILG